MKPSKLSFAVFPTVMLIALFAQPLLGGTPKEFPYPINQPIRRPSPIVAQSVVVSPGEQGNQDLVASLDTVLATIGRGYNSFTDQLAGPECVSGFVVGPRPTSFAPSFDIKLVESYEQFAEETSAAASVSGGFSTFSASVKTKFDQASRSKSNTQFLLVRVMVIAAPDINIKDARLNVAEPASDDPEALRKFFRQCGDQYVSKIQMGGAFIAVLTFAQSESELKRSLSIDATSSGFGVSGTASFTTQLNSLRVESNLEISATQIGGDGSGGLPAFNLDSLIAYTRDFPTKVNAQTVAPVGFTAESFVILGADLPDRLVDVRRNYDKVSAAAFAADGHAGDLEGLQDLLTRNGIPGVHSAQDISVRTADALRTTESDYRDMTDALAACADAFWVAEKCNFDPRYLDYKLPSPGPLYIRRLETKSATPVNLKLPRDMTLELRGNYCWSGRQCTRDGIYPGGVVGVNVAAPNVADVYRGLPMRVTAGRLIVTAADNEYGDNSGDLFVFVY